MSYRFKLGNLRHNTVLYEFTISDLDDGFRKIKDFTDADDYLSGYIDGVAENMDFNYPAMMYFGTFWLYVGGN